jgi:hypothetical protein
VPPSSPELLQTHFSTPDPDHSTPELPFKLLTKFWTPDPFHLVSITPRVGPFVRSFNFLLESGTPGSYYSNSNPNHFKNLNCLLTYFSNPDSRSRSLQNRNYLKTWTTFPLLYTNFSTLDPDHSIHILFYPQFFLNTKLGLNYFSIAVPDQVKPYLLVNSLPRRSF